MDGYRLMIKKYRAFKGDSLLKNKFIFIPLLAGLLTVFVVLGAAGLLDRAETRRYVQEFREKTYEHAGTLRQNIEKELNFRLSLVRALSAFVQTNPEIDLPSFNTFTSNLIGKQTGIRSLQLAPNSIVSFVYPLKGNEQAVGHDLLADPERRDAVVLAIRHKKFLIAGPVTLRQGGIALIGRLPVFKQSSSNPNGNSTYWGLSTILIDLIPMLRDAGLIDSGLPYRFALRGKDGLGADGEVFFGAPEVFQSDGILMDIGLPNGTWQLGVAPQNGWPTRWPGEREFWIFSILLAIVAGSLVYLLVVKPSQLKHAVEEATRKLQASELRYRYLFNHAHDSIFTIDSESRRFIEINETGLKRLGYDREEIFQLTMEDVFTINEEGNGFSRMKILEHQEGTLSEGLQHSKDEVNTPVEISSSIIGLVEGDVILSFVRDISERKRAHEELVKLSTVVEMIPNSVVITDSNGIFEYVNPAFTKSTGYLLEEIKGQTPRILKSGKQNEKFYDDLWETISSGHTWSGHFINKTKDGTLIEEDAVIIPMKNLEGIIQNYIAVKTDVTEHLQLELQLSQSQKMEAVGTLAGGIAHEFNNILTPILGYTELLQGRLEKGSREQEYLLILNKGVDRAKNLVAQILQFSRLKTGERVTMNLMPVLMEVMKLLEAALPSTIAISSEISSGSAMIEANATEIHTMLMNLCVNARDAMPQGGELRVSLKTNIPQEKTPHEGELEGKFILIEVSDTGVGMNDEVLGKIFDPFFSTKEVGKGTGLGMSTVYGIVEHHGGHIQISSSPGEGTTVQVFFLEQEIHEETASNQIQNVFNRRGTESILLVDDEADILMFAGEALKTLGYRVTLAGSSTEALTLFRSAMDSFDLVLSDVTMPNLSGEILMAEIQKLRPDVPFILMTGYTDALSENLEGPDFLCRIISKPFTISELGNSIRDLLEWNDGTRKRPSRSHMT